MKKYWQHQIWQKDIRTPMEALSRKMDSGEMTGQMNITLMKTWTTSRPCHMYHPDYSNVELNLWKTLYSTAWRMRSIPKAAWSKELSGLRVGWKLFGTPQCNSHYMHIRHRGIHGLSTSGQPERDFSTESRRADPRIGPDPETLQKGAFGLHLLQHCFWRHRARANCDISHLSNWQHQRWYGRQYRSIHCQQRRNLSGLVTNVILFCLVTGLSK